MLEVQLWVEAVHTLPSEEVEFEMSLRRSDDWSFHYADFRLRHGESEILEVPVEPLVVWASYEWWDPAYSGVGESDTGSSIYAGSECLGFDEVVPVEHETTRFKSQPYCFRGWTD